MKSYLIIPMGGKGQRFVDSGYSTYKVFLPVDKKNTILEKIISNFKGLNSQVIIIANFTSLGRKYDSVLKKKNIHLINIKNHKKGPLYTLYVAHEKIKNIVKDNKNIFISYSDINWKWNANEIKKSIGNKKMIVFTHNQFHPHLEVNSKSDFCKVKKKKIMDIKEKSTFSKDYKDDYLAIGCYYFNTLSYLNHFLENQYNLFNQKKEFYMVSLIKYFLKKKIEISNFNISEFVHLGTPDQYTDFLSWKNSFNIGLVKKANFKTNATIMLAAGKGERVSDLNKLKPFLNYNNQQIYKYIFNCYKSSKKIIITNKILNKKFDKKKYEVFSINNTKSMFETIFKSKEILLKQDNYFLTSCDCFGKINMPNLKKFILNNNADLLLFAFTYSNLQKSLGSSHTQLKIKNKVLYDIDVKKEYINDQMGHAGFFWIKSGKVFNFLNDFKVSKYFKKLKREVLIDDYFKYLIVNKLVKTAYFKLDNYTHIGSGKEYLEYKYWNNYFMKNYV